MRCIKAYEETLSKQLAQNKVIFHSFGMNIIRLINKNYYFERLNCILFKKKTK